MKCRSVCCHFGPLLCCEQIYKAYWYISFGQYCIIHNIHDEHDVRVFEKSKRDEMKP